MVQKSICLDKRGVMPLIALGLVGLLFFSISYGLVSTGSLGGSYTQVYKQNWGSICCEQKDSYDFNKVFNADKTKAYTCDDLYTNECEITFDYNPSSLSCGNAWYQVEAGQRRRPIDGQTIKINYAEIISFGEDFCLGKDSLPFLDYRVKSKSFYIKGMENGKVYQQESCVLNSNLKKRVLSDGLNWLLFDECQNYMIDFVLTATKTYNYNNREVVCQARQLYEVEETTFKNGATRKIQTDRIKSVECCPSESNCDSKTFKFIEKPKARECSIDSECANGGDPVATTGTSYITFDCSNEGKCKQSAEKQVECTNNAICIQKYGEGSVCDLSNVNYGKCKDATEVRDYCGDGVCSSVASETPDSCPVDCIPNPEVGWPWWVWLLIIFAILAVLVFLWPALLAFLKSIRSTAKSLPLIGGLFP